MTTRTSTTSKWAESFAAHAAAVADVLTSHDVNHPQVEPDTSPESQARQLAVIADTEFQTNSQKGRHAGRTHPLLHARAAAALLSQAYHNHAAGNINLAQALAQSARNELDQAAQNLHPGLARHYLNEYLVHLRYAGPEEGGTYHAIRQFIRTRLVTKTMRAAELAMQTLMPSINQENAQRPALSSVRSNGLIELRVECQPGTAHPGFMPSYQ